MSLPYFCWWCCGYIGYWPCLSWNTLGQEMKQRLLANWSQIVSGKRLFSLFMLYFEYAMCRSYWLLSPLLEEQLWESAEHRSSSLCGGIRSLGQCLWSGSSGSSLPWWSGQPPPHVLATDWQSAPGKWSHDQSSSCFYHVLGHNDTSTNHKFEVSKVFWDKVSICPKLAWNLWGGPGWL